MECSTERLPKDENVSWVVALTQALNAAGKIRPWSSKAEARTAEDYSETSVEQVLQNAFDPYSRPASMCRSL